MSTPHRLRPLMRAARRVRALPIVALMIAISAAGAVAYAAQPAKAGIAIAVAPSSQSVTRGQVASYTMTVSSTGGFSGAATLSVDGLPAAATSVFAPGIVSLTAGGQATSTLTVSTASSTPVGSTSLMVTAASGKLTASISFGLTVNYPLSGSLSLGVSPAAVSLAAGQSAIYTAQLQRINLVGAVSFAVATGLPAAAAVSFTPTPTTGNSTTLQLTTTSATPTGSYTLTVLASGADARGSVQFAYATVTLTVTDPEAPFAISGNLSGALAPGTTLPLNLSLGNPNKKPLTVTNLTVTLAGITRTPAAIAANLACQSSDYTVTPYTGPYPLSLPASTSSTLSALAIPVVDWPQVTMLNTAVNQDGCKGATVSLVYSGSGTGN